MHILGFILIVSGLLTITYFSGPENNSEQNNQPLPQDKVRTLPINSPSPVNKEDTVTIKNKKTGEVKQVPTINLTVPYQYYHNHISGVGLYL